MKLENWFAQMRDQRLSDKEKTLVYSRVLNKTHQGVLIKRINFYARAGLATFTIIGAVVFFLTSSIPSTLVPTDNIDGPLVTVNKPLGNIAQADTIGKLITVEGSISVFDGDKKIDGVRLNYGNKVLLQEGARVELIVRQGVMATIVGPAVISLDRFEDEDGKTATVLNLIEGSYFEIVNVKISEEDSEIFLELPEEEPLIVKTEKFEIQQMPEERNMRVVITKEDNVQKVSNEGGSDIIVKKLGNDEDGSLTVIGQDQFASLGEKDISKESERIEQELKDKQLTIRYEIEQPLSIETSSQENLPEEDLSEEDLSEEKPIIIIDSNKRVIEQEIMEIIEGSLSLGFVAKHTKDIAIYRAMGNSQGVNNSVGTLQGLLNRARISVGLGAISNDLTSLHSGMTELATYLQNTYYVTPSLIGSIRGMSYQLQITESVPLGLYKDIKDVNEVVSLLNENGYNL